MTFDADVIIVGAGPAGLSAALVLGRACRKVLVFDHGPRRATASRTMLHGFITREGIAAAGVPADRSRGTDALRQRPARGRRRSSVAARAGRRGGFDVSPPTAAIVRRAPLLLATGVVDNVPDIPGLADLYGQQRVSLPVLRRLGAARASRLPCTAARQRGYGLSLELTRLEPRTFCSAPTAPSGFDAEERATLGRNGIRRSAKNASRALEGRTASSSASSSPTARRFRVSALFFTHGSARNGPISRGSLGCEFNEKGTVSTREVTKHERARASTSPATRRATCSGSSSRPPKARKRRIRSIRS